MKNRKLRFWFVMLNVFTCGTVFFALATGSAEAGGHEDRDKDKYAIIDCWSKQFLPVGEAKPDSNKVKEGRKLKWQAYGPENTKVTITFGKDPNYPNCEGTSPDDDLNPKSETIGSSEHEDLELKVKEGKGGTDPGGKCYVYKITCNSDQVSEGDTATQAVLDPMIEVPKP